MSNMKHWIGTIMTATSLLAFTGIASAHVTVAPKETSTGAYEKYTFRMPVEKDINTTGLRIEFPAGEKLSAVEPVPGWNYALENDANGNPQAITWKATAGGIKPHEFMEFSIVGVNPKQTGTLNWKAYQTYADGSVVEWTGDPGSKTPAPVTVITQAAAGGSGHQADAGSTTNPQNNTSGGMQMTPAPASGNANIGPYILSGVAILLSLIGLFRKKS